MRDAIMPPRRLFVHAAAPHAMRAMPRVCAAADAPQLTDCCHTPDAMPSLAQRYAAMPAVDYFAMLSAPPPYYLLLRHADARDV